MPTAAALGGAAIAGQVISSKATKKATKAQVAAGDRAAATTAAGTKQARDDLFRLFPSAQEAGQQGFQGALDVFNQSVPAQQQAFQGGNVAAQNQILAGLPQIQNALFGNQVDLSQLQAYNPQQQDMSFLNQQLPFTQQQNQNAQLNGGLGGFDPNNSSFNNMMGPFQQGQPSIYDSLNRGTRTNFGQSIFGGGNGGGGYKNNIKRIN